MCGNKDDLEGYLCPEGIDWRKIHEDAISSDLEVARKGRKAYKQLIFAGILTPNKKGAWYFSEENMNPYCAIPDSEEMGRVCFVRKRDAIDYGKANWLDRLNNWTITNGKEKITRLEICRG
jgi:hypothetical protein